MFWIALSLREVVSVLFPMDSTLVEVGLNECGTYIPRVFGDGLWKSDCHVSNAWRPSTHPLE